MTENSEELDNNLDNHYIHRSNWLIAAFTIGGLLPFLVTLFLPLNSMEYSFYGSVLLFLIILGIVTAKTGGSIIWKAILRITFWGTIAMGLTAIVGYYFNANIS